MRVGLIALWLWFAAAAAVAQDVRVPEGWASRVEDGSLAIASPADRQGRRVVYMLRQAETVSGNAETWFRRKVAALVSQHRLILNGKLEREGTLLKIAHVVRTREGADVSYNAYAYAAGAGQQLILLYYPDSLDASDPRVGTALEGAAVTDQTDGWTVLGLSGTGAVDVLARLVPMDLRLAAFPVGRAVRTQLNHMNVVILRVSDYAFEIMAFRSMARTAWHEVETTMHMVAARAGTKI